MAEFNIDNSPRDDNKSDEVINVRLPRAEYEILRKVIKREEALGWVASWALWVGGPLLALFLLWDRIQLFFVKV